VAGGGAVKSRAPASRERDEATGVERFATTWCDHRTQQHAHPEYQITITDAGGGRYDYLGGRAVIPPGCLALFHPGEPHVLATAERAVPWRVRSLHIPPRWLEAAGMPLLQPAPLTGDGGLGAAVAAVWDAVGDARRDLRAELRRLAAMLRARPGLEPGARPRSALVRICLDHLAATPGRPVSCAELARLARSTVAQVRRALGAATGLPPHAWHLQRRIEEAKHRLASGAPIVDTALAMGFADQAHFTRHFTRLVGVSPARYVAGVRPADDRA
jgi:AraC-like DNA-binding protein